MSTRLMKEEFHIGQFAGTILCELEVNPDAGSVELISEFRAKSPEGEDNFSIRHRSVVSNPIDLTVITSPLSTKFAMCIARGFAALATAEIYQAYQETKSDLQTREGRPPLAERVRTFGNKISGRSESFKAVAIGAITTCIMDAISPA